MAHPIRCPQCRARARTIESLVDHLLVGCGPTLAPLPWSSDVYAILDTGHDAGRSGVDEPHDANTLASQPTG